MNASLVNLLLWTKPLKSFLALISVNLVCWFLTCQRPLSSLSIIVLTKYMHSLWVSRLRPAMLVNPPDDEQWVDLRVYDLQHGVWRLCAYWVEWWRELRRESPVVWTLLTSCTFITLAKLGTCLTFGTMTFAVSNSAFALPLLSWVNLEGLLSNSPSTPSPPTSIHSYSNHSRSPTPNLSISLMPGHEDSEDEFLFDHKHFESESSTSSSASFEVINI